MHIINNGSPNHESLMAYTHFGHTGNCSRYHFVNYRQTIVVVFIGIYLSTGIERRGVSDRLLSAAYLPVVVPLKSGGSNVATAAEPFPAEALSCLSPIIVRGCSTY